MTYKKLLSLLVLTLLQIGCAEQPVYQKPAPVHRSHAKIHRNEISKSVQTYQYPEEASPQNRPSMQELAPGEQLIAPNVQSPNIPSEPLSPAVLALVSEAEQNSQSGQYETAAVKIERALRIDPRNALLTYKLAAIRLKQEQPRLAEDLAKKAVLLAGGDRNLKKQIWLLISESKRAQQDPTGAAQAAQKAAEY